MLVLLFLQDRKFIVQVDRALDKDFRSTRMYAFGKQKYIFVFLLTSTFTGRRQWHPTPVLLPGQSYGQRRLVGCSPWGR